METKDHQCSSANVNHRILPAKGGDAMERQGIRHYRRRLQKVQEMNLTSDLFSSIVFEDTSAVQDIRQRMI